MHPDKPRLDEGDDPRRSPDAPEDVAGLYHWANLEGAKYRDFSADRDQARSSRRQPKEPATAAANVTPGPRRLLTAVKKSTQLQPPPKRWSALRSLFDPAAAVNEMPAPPDIVLDIPSVAFVSPAGGVGKTFLAAHVARTLAAQGRTLQLVDTQPCGMLPLIYSNSELNPGIPSTIPCGNRGGSIEVLTLRNGPSEAAPDPRLIEQIANHAESAQLILIDAASGSAAMLDDILGFASDIVVILTPDMASVAGLQPLRALIESAISTEPTPRIHYLLNQFNAAARLHVAIRDALTAQLDGQLLPFVLPYSSSLQEALADGTSLDLYAPDDPLLWELQQLAQWIVELHQSSVAEQPARRWRAL